MGALSRLAGLVRTEDVLIVVWGIVIAPIFFPPDTASGSVETGSDPLAGLLGTVAIVGVIVVLLTRAPGEAPQLAESAMTPMAYARFPLTFAMFLVADEAATDLGIDAIGSLGGLGFLAAIVSFVAYPWLPAIPLQARRLLVWPLVIQAAGLFRELTGPVADVLDLGELGPAIDQYGSLAWFFVIMFVAVSAIYYVALVFAPRQVAEPEGSWLAWSVRYVVFLGALVLGTAWPVVL